MARQGALSLVDQAISSATNFATSVIIARLGSRAELGLYVLAMSIVFLVRLLQEQIVVAHPTACIATATTAIPWGPTPGQRFCASNLAVRRGHARAG